MTKIKTKPLTEEENRKLAYELKREVEQWVDRFNFIQIDVLEAVAEKEGTQLLEYIVNPEITWEEIADHEGHYGDKKWIKSQQKEYPNIEEHPSYDSVRDQQQQDNYPMWNTCFEFKEKESEDVILAALDEGLGVIEGFGDFNQILFMKSAGHSFYSSYWIPLFLRLPWNTHLKEKYRGVKYDNL